MNNKSFWVNLYDNKKEEVDVLLHDIESIIIQTGELLGKFLLLSPYSS
jgi:hypothetical protein